MQHRLISSALQFLQNIQLKGHSLKLRSFVVKSLSVSRVTWNSIAKILLSEFILEAEFHLLKFKVPFRPMLDWCTRYDRGSSIFKSTMWCLSSSIAYWSCLVLYFHLSLFHWSINLQKNPVDQRMISKHETGSSLQVCHVLYCSFYRPRMSLNLDNNRGITKTLDSSVLAYLHQALLWASSPR